MLKFPKRHMWTTCCCEALICAVFFCRRKENIHFTNHCFQKLQSNLLRETEATKDYLWMVTWNENMTNLKHPITLGQCTMKNATFRIWVVADKKKKTGHGEHWDVTYKKLVLSWRPVSTLYETQFYAQLLPQKSKFIYEMFFLEDGAIGWS